MGALVSTDGIVIQAANKINQALRLVRRRDQLTTIVIGNSIAAACKYSGGYALRADFIWANEFAGLPMRFKRMTASTRADLYGCYGYSSQTLPTINADLQSQLFTPLQTAGIVPELALLHSLLENDLINSRTVPQMQSAVRRLITTLQTLYPGIIILLCTPRLTGASGVYSQSDFLEITEWMIGLDDGQSIFVTDMSQAFPHPSYPERAAIQSFTGSISGTTLTVSSIGDAELGQGIWISGSGVTAGTYITAPASVNADGTGTYTVSASQTVSSTTMTAYPFTDNGPHQNGRGASICGRLMAATLARIADVWRLPHIVQSSNPALTGSTSASATGLSGTKPNDSTCTFGTVNQATVVSTAEDPGHLLAVSGLIDRTAAYSTGYVDWGAETISGPTQVAGMLEVEIVSGAENIRHIQCESRINDGGGNNFQQGKRQTSTEVDGEYQDGDVLTLAAGPFIAASGSITGVNAYLAMYPKALQKGTGSFSVRVRKKGALLVA